MKTQIPSSKSQLPRSLMALLVGVVAAIFVAAAVIAVVEADLQVGLIAQARQAPIFEPDPLWAQALPNKWATGAGRRHRGRLARQRLGLSAPRDDSGKRARRVAESAGVRMLHPGAERARVQPRWPAAAGLGKAGRGL